MLEAIAQAADAVRARTSIAPRHALILGTGLGDVSGLIQDPVAIPYGDIPGFVVSTAESHAGELVLGTVHGKPVAVMNGRLHYYEGYSMKEVTFPIRVLRALGAEHLLVTNAVGGMHPLHQGGDIVAVVDHINLMGDNPLIGPNHDDLGPRFPDMSEPYDKRLLALVEQVALEEKLPLKQGVFVGVAGPNLETRAEYRFLRALGADVVGMSLIPENLVAVHGGMKVLALAVVTDTCFPEALEPVNIENILQVAAGAEPKLTRLVSGVLERL